MTLSKEQIEAIQARAEKATPGPWQTKSDFDQEGRTTIISNVDGEIVDGITHCTFDVVGRCCDEFEEYISGSNHDAVFIAYSRTDIPALCQQALRAIELEADNEKLKRCVDFAEDYLHVFSPAIGMARMALANAKPDSALEHLDRACDATDAIDLRYNRRIADLSPHTLDGSQRHSDYVAKLQSELTAARNALEQERERCAKAIREKRGPIEAANPKAGAAYQTGLQDAEVIVRALPSPQVKG
jgi:hypothetical protein